VGSNVRVTSFALLGLLVGATACADTPSTAPISKSPLLRRDAASVTSRGPTRFANSIKYRDKGLKHARARAGIAATAATLEARALLGRDGSTTLDISTGAIDAPDASQLLSKVQLKQYAPNGELQITTNYKQINSPVYQLTLAGRVRGSNLQVQGSIVGVDGKHSDVVTLTETVKLRPDVSVDRITAPAQSLLRVPVSISALISENNGDVGARADCVLAVDGVEVSRARGIWVDAGRSVSCLFSHDFPTTGTKQLTVSAVSVNPGDWNESNNAATSTIQITLPRNEFTWNGSYFSVRNQTGWTLAEGSWYRTDVVASGVYRVYQDFHRQDTWFARVSGRVGVMEPPFTFSFQDEIDGKLLNRMEFDPTTDQYSTYEGTYEDPDFGTVHYLARCTLAFKIVPIVWEGQTIDAWQSQILICTWLRDGPSGPLPQQSYTEFTFDTSAGDVSYYAEDSWACDGCVETGVHSSYSFNGDVEFTYGTVVFGTDYSFMLNISGSDQSKTASGTIHTTTESFVNTIPYSCRDEVVDGIFFQNACFAGDYRQTVTSGLASGTPD
jgi:hypothetical protein